MSDVMFAGVFYETSMAAIGGDLIAFLERPGAAEALKVDGEEAQYVDDTIDLFIQALETEGEFSMEGEFFGSLAEADTWLTGYIEHLQRQGALIQFDLWVEDDDGEVQGEMKLFNNLPSRYRSV